MVLTDGWPLVGRRAETDRFVERFLHGDATRLVLYGAPGVGKTRLADRFLELAEQAGAPTARVVASRAAASLPLGALAPVLPPDLEMSSTPAELLARAAAEVAARTGGPPLLLLVDDAHLLDSSSAVLLTQLVEQGALRLIATVRADGDAIDPGAPDAVAGWWRQPGADRVDVADLDEATTAELLAAALGSPVGRDTVHRLHRASGGNPLLLRELVREARSAGHLRDDSGTWQVVGDVLPSRRLRDLLADRLAGLDPTWRDLLEVLALCGPLGPAELGIDQDAPALAGLERSGLVRTAGDGRRLQVALAHPLTGEVLRAEQTALARRSRLLATADRVEALGARRREDPRRIATWRLDAGGRPDPELVLSAAHVARFAHDFVQVERLARVRLDDGASLAASVLLGEALYELGSFDEAEAVLAVPAAPADADPALLVRRAAVRAKNLQWGRGDWPGALAVIDEARAQLDGPLADELRTEEASVLMFSGSPQAAIDVLASIDHGPPRVAVQGAMTLAASLASVGRTTEAVGVAVAGFDAHLALDDTLGLSHPGTHVVNQAFALIEGGRFAEAEQLATVGHGVAVEDHIPIAQIWFALLMARSLTHRGQYRAVREWSREAASTGRVHGFLGPLRVALSGLAAAEAVLGDPDAAAAATAELDALPAFGFLHHDQALGPAWTAWAQGDPVAARTRLAAEAEAAEGTANRITAAWLWHDAARLGADAVAGRLAALVDRCDSPVVAARSAHVAALERDDGPALVEAAGAFEDLGMVLLAAEASWSAADALRRAGLQRPAAAADRRAADLARRCEGVRTPGLFRPDVVVPLTRREREVADLACRGLSGPKIAEALGLSTRTVQNHLQNAYTKLGINRREELTAALRPS